jgi:V8-like Glu-specific endopeptidase
MIFGSIEKIEEYYRNKLNKEEIYYGNYENFEVQKCSLTELFNLLKDYK